MSHYYQKIIRGININMNAEINYMPRELHILYLFHYCKYFSQNKRSLIYVKQHPFSVPFTILIASHWSETCLQCININNRVNVSLQSLVLYY